MKRRTPRPRRATVVIVGSLNMDLVVRVPHLPQPAETLTGSAFQCLPGGKGANQAVAIARLGGRSRMIGRVGDDAFGRELLRGLRAEGVDTRAVSRLAGTATGVAAIAVDADGQNCITVVAGANGRLRPADLRLLESMIAKADALLLQLEIPLPTVAAAARIARRHHVFTVLDTAPVPAEGLPNSLRDLDLLSPNQVEASQLTGLPCETPDDAVQAAEVLVRRLNPGVVVVKMGKLGAVAHAGGDHSAFNPAFDVKAVDTTAAGDAFTAALTLRLAEGANLGEALRFANAAGALACTRLGAQNSMPTRTEVDRFLRRHPPPSHTMRIPPLPPATPATPATPPSPTAHRLGRWLACGLGFLLPVLGGCGPADPGSAGAAGGSASTRTNPTGNAIAHKPRVALIMKSLANEFFLTMEKGAQAHQKAHAADYDLLANGIKDELDVARQIDMVEQMIAQKVDAVVIAPADSKALVAVCKKAQEAGVVVVNIDNKLDDGVLAEKQVRIPFIGPDNRKGARKVGDVLAKRLKAGDEVAVIEGPPNAFNAQQRRLGFHESMQAAGMKIVSSQSGFWETDKANQVAASVITEHPELKAILASNDSMALGAVAALRAAGKLDQIQVVGYDNISAVQTLLKEGRILATADQHADQIAVFGIEYALQLLQSKAAPADKETPVDLIGPLSGVGRKE